MQDFHFLRLEWVPARGGQEGAANHHPFGKMYLSHEFQIASRPALGPDFFSESSSIRDSVHNVCYVNSKNQLQYAVQYKPEKKINAT